MASRRSFRSALITGATSGIGAAFARELARQGSQLVLIGRNRERLTAMQEELSPFAPVEILAADLSTSQGIDAVTAHIKALSQLDLLINNAGFGLSGSFAEIDATNHELMVNLHVLACMHLTHAALPGMQAQQRGAIINVASIRAFMPVLANVSYAATKAYVVNFSLALSTELHGTGVRVQALCPGLTRTEFHERGRFTQAALAPRFLWSTPDFVVQQSMHCLEKNRTVCIPGFWNRRLVRWSQWPLLSWFIVRQNRRLYRR